MKRHVKRRMRKTRVPCCSKKSFEASSCGNTKEEEESIRTLFMRFGTFRILLLRVRRVPFLSFSFHASALPRLGVCRRTESFVSESISKRKREGNDAVDAKVKRKKRISFDACVGKEGNEVGCPCRISLFRTKHPTCPEMLSWTLLRLLNPNVLNIPCRMWKSSFSVGRKDRISTCKRRLLEGFHGMRTFDVQEQDPSLSFRIFISDVFYRGRNTSRSRSNTVSLLVSCS